VFEPTARRLAAGLARVAAAVHHASDSSSLGVERTLAQQQILLMLAQRPPHYPLTDLAADLGMSLGDTLAALSALVREQLATMTPEPSYSPHEVIVDLTVRGRAHAPEATTWAAHFLAQLDTLEHTEQRRLLRVVTEHIEGLQRRDEIPVAKMCVTCRFFDGYAHPGSDAPHHCWLVDAPFGHRQLRLRCPEQEPAVVNEPASGSGSTTGSAPR
jgi:DNA-binding MarR family transcriptional regulator